MSILEPRCDGHCDRQGNKALLCSTVACTLVHAYYMFSLEPTSDWYGAFLIGGLLTSVLNHGGFQWGRLIDRLYIRTAFVVDLLLSKGTTRALFAASGLSYGLSKVCQKYGLKREPLHIVCHALATVAHVQVMLQRTKLKVL